MSFWPFVRNRTDDVEAVLKEERPRVYRLALAITSSHDAAEDVTQEVLCRYVLSAPEIDAPRAWMRRVAIRLARESGHASEVQLPSDVLQRSLSPDEAMAVAGALASISLEHRTILALALMEGLSYREIAEALQIPMGSVASRLHEAKKAFRKRWES